MESQLADIRPATIAVCPSALRLRIDNTRTSSALASCQLAESRRRHCVRRRWISLHGWQFSRTCRDNVYRGHHLERHRGTRLWLRRVCRRQENVVNRACFDSDRIYDGRRPCGRRGQLCSRYPAAYSSHPNSGRCEKATNRQRQDIDGPSPFADGHNPPWKGLRHVSRRQHWSVTSPSVRCLGRLYTVAGGRRGPRRLSTNIHRQPARVPYEDLPRRLLWLRLEYYSVTFVSRFHPSRWQSNMLVIWNQQLTYISTTRPWIERTRQ